MLVYKVGVVVNDVASVNIDAQLIANAGIISSTDTVQLENGCACCSMQDELLTTLAQLTEEGTKRYDQIIIELSGVGQGSG